MSNHVYSLCRKKMTGVGATAKAVLLLMADLASENGAGIWASKQTMANELEMSKRAFQGAVQRLIEAGLLVEIGTRKHRNGLTIEYQIAVQRLQECPDSNPKRGAGNAPVNTTYSNAGTKCTSAGNAPVQEMHGRGAGNAPHGVQEMHPTHPVTTLEHGGGGARAIDTLGDTLDLDTGSPTFRERLLAAIGADPVSGLIGPNGRMFGSRTDMAIAQTWIGSLGLSEDQIVAEVQDVMARKRDGPPSSFEYFTKPLQRFAGVLQEPPPEPKLRAIAGGQHGKFDDALRETARRIRSGEVKFGTDDSDPFA